jgi:hypothetical protein
MDIDFLQKNEYFDKLSCNLLGSIINHKFRQIPFFLMQHYIFTITYL